MPPQVENQFGMKAKVPRISIGRQMLQSNIIFRMSSGIDASMYPV